MSGNGKGLDKMQNCLGYHNAPGCNVQSVSFKSGQRGFSCLSCKRHGWEHKNCQDLQHQKIEKRMKVSNVQH